MVRATAPYDIRYSVITFAGQKFKVRRPRSTRSVKQGEARTLSNMSDDTAAIEAGLDEVLHRSSLGSADFYAGVRRANQSIIDGRVRDRESSKVIMYLSNTPGPIFRERGSVIQGAISANMAAALREAARFEIVLHSFGFTKEASDWKGLGLGQSGRQSGGTYSAVLDPSELYCRLVDALVSRARDPETTNESASLAEEL